MISIIPEYWKRAIRVMEKMETEVVADDIPPVGSVFDLKSGARAS
jgi:hypothetical protein